MEKKIHDRSRLYLFLRGCVDFMFKASYRKVEYCGKEHIPQEGVVIYAPNHTNTLMDALAVLAIDKKAKVFVARADIFQNPIVLKFLTFLKMLPIHRKRDGVENLAKNEDINDVVVEALRHGLPFCILPEGTHRAMYSLMPLQKGIFRIALQANDALGAHTPVYIVPVGITFGHFFRYRSSLLVRIGAPVHITQFVQEHPQLSVPHQINALRQILTERLKGLILHIADDERYHATLSLVQLFGKEQLQSVKTDENRLIHRLAAAQEVVRQIESLIETNPQEMGQNLSMANEFYRRRQALGIGIESALKPNIRLWLLLNFILLLLGLPYALFSLVATAPVTLPSVWLCSKFEDGAFHNTVRYLISLVLLPLLLLLGGVTLFVALSWVWGVAFLLFFPPSFFFLHEYLRLWRRTISDIKWLIHRDLYTQSVNIKSMTAPLIT